MQAIFVTLTFIFSLVAVVGHPYHPPPDGDYPQGQLEPNVLRHATSLSNIPSFFGRTRSMILSRKIVAQGGIWQSVDAFTRLLHAHPMSLDMISADIRLLPGSRPQLVTLNAAFMCMDRGKSTSTPIQITGARKMRTTLNESLDTGFVFYSGNSTDSPDIVTSCLLNRQDFNATLREGFKPVQAEYQRVHKADPLRFIPIKPIPATYLDDNTFFERLFQERTDRANSDKRVIYDTRTNIPVVIGLPFVTGVRLWISNETGLRVPTLLSSAVNLISEERLRVYVVGRGNPPTNPTQMWLNVQSQGLQLVVAFYFVMAVYVQAYLKRANQTARLNVREAVNGGHQKWDFGDVILFLSSVFSALILIAPIWLAAVEGKLDPREQYEVTTGCTVFYGVVQRGPEEHQDYSIDKTNWYSGAPFVVSSFISVRKISDGLLFHLLVACLVVLAVTVSLTVAQTREVSSVMPAYPSRLHRFAMSVWKFYGSLVLNYNLVHRKIKPPSFLQAFIRLRGDALNDPSALAFPIVSASMRQRALKGMFPKRRREFEEQWKLLSNKIRTQLKQHCHDLMNGHEVENFFVELIANVRLDSPGRYEAMMAEARSWGDWSIPRHWEYISRGVRTIIPDVRNMNWYRTAGRVAPDEALLLSKLGMLDHMEYVERVLITDDEEGRKYDEDGCQVIIGLVPSPIPPEQVDLPNGPRYERMKSQSGFDPANSHGERFNILILKDDIDVKVVLLAHEQIYSNGCEKV